jgi:hypothetical protein
MASRLNYWDPPYNRLVAYYWNAHHIVPGAVAHLESATSKLLLRTPYRLVTRCEERLAPSCNSGLSRTVDGRPTMMHLNRLKDGWRFEGQNKR